MKQKILQFLSAYFQPSDSKYDFTRKYSNETPAKNFSEVYLKQEVSRLSDLANDGDWCPSGGWQYPFDFGQGVRAPTYTSKQKMHLWRREILAAIVDQNFKGENLSSLSVLDLGSGEGALTQTLWSMGFRDITCVEVRDSNIEKARFVYDVFGIDAEIIASDVESFLESNDRKYDLVVFMGLLYHLTDPIGVVEKVGKIVRRLCVCETVVAQPKLSGFRSKSDYSPTEAAFYVRIDSSKSHTAGTRDIELWPNESALNLIFSAAGLSSEILYFDNHKSAPDFFRSGGRVFVTGEPGLGGLGH